MIIDFNKFVNEENIENLERPYVSSTKKIDGVIVSEADKDFNDNPLFYIWSEYPTYKKIDKGFLIYSYEFYKDKDGNKYFVCSDLSKLSDDEIKAYITKHDWNHARNVDDFVEGADKAEYARWLDLIS